MEDPFTFVKLTTASSQSVSTFTTKLTSANTTNISLQSGFCLRLCVSGPEGDPNTTERETNYHDGLWWNTSISEPTVTNTEHYDPDIKELERDILNLPKDFSCLTDRGCVPYSSTVSPSDSALSTSRDESQRSRKLTPPNSFGRNVLLRFHYLIEPSTTFHIFGTRL